MDSITIGPDRQDRRQGYHFNRIRQTGQERGRALKKDQTDRTGDRDIISIGSDRQDRREGEH